MLTEMDPPLTTPNPPTEFGPDQSRENDQFKYQVSPRTSNQHNIRNIPTLKLDDLNKNKQALTQLKYAKMSSDRMSSIASSR